MSSENLFLEDEALSPDMFSDPDISNSGANMTDDSSSASGNIAEPVKTYPEWKGISMDEIYKGFSPYDFEHLPPIVPSHNHTVLIALPLPAHGVPKPYPSQPVDKWNQDYVRLPHSAHSRYPNNKEDSSDGLRHRWEVIQEALLQTFYSSRQLEQAILSYNHKYSQRWDFKALHHFFSNEIDDDETSLFFNNLLPKIIGLALQLPELLTGGIPLLKRHTNASISLSQIQVASLLANAFLCTFPRRNSSSPQSEYANYPDINFNRLFSSMAEKRGNRTQSVMEKLKCIFHYFRRVTSKVPEGIITIQRKYIVKENCPKWETRDESLPLLHITSKGTIESEGNGLLQVDFANKYVGGGVMNYGCVQEEIRFVICPELFVTMLVTEALDDTEALVVCGVEQYSKYEGYSNNFQWAGDFVDETPRDNSGRRKTCIVAIDALYFRQPNLQFNIDNITRELNKAYVGFSVKEMPDDNLSAIATGNWGCGAFRGNPKLKVLLQLIAAAVAKRSVVYFTFGDTELRDTVADMYWFLVGQNLTIGQLYNLLADYNENSQSSTKHSDFYRFLYNKAKMKDYVKKLSFKSKSKFQLERKSPEATINKVEVKKEIKTQIKNDVPFSRLTDKEKEEFILKCLEESDDEKEDKEEIINEKSPDKRNLERDKKVVEKTNFVVQEQDAERSKKIVEKIDARNLESDKKAVEREDVVMKEQNIEKSTKMVEKENKWFNNQQNNVNVIPAYLNCKETQQTEKCFKISLNELKIPEKNLKTDAMIEKELENVVEITHGYDKVESKATSNKTIIPESIESVEKNSVTRNTQRKISEFFTPVR